MGLTVDHIEIRYRPSDSAAAWTFVTVPAGQGSIQLKGVERGRSYQIEARSVAPSGAASAWVAQTHVVADATILPLAPTGLSATPVADGVALKWAVASTQRPDAEYEVWRTTDLAGAPDPAGWTQIQVVTALAWTDPITDGVLRWYRVRSHDFSGHTSAYSSNINSRGKTVADGADVSKNNVPLTLFNPKFEAGDIGWTRGGLFTIEINGNAFEGAWCGVCRGTGSAQSDALRNTVFNPVVPGQMVMVRGMIKGSGADGYAQARISWRDSSQVEFAVTTAGVHLTGTFAHTLSKVVGPAPSGAAFAVMEWEVIGQTAGTYYFDAAYLDYLSSDLSEVPDAAGSLRYAVREIDTNRRSIVDFTQGHLSKNVDNIADGVGFVRTTPNQRDGGGRGFVGLDGSGDLARDIIATRKVAGKLRLLADIADMSRGVYGQNILENPSFEIATNDVGQDTAGAAMWVNETNTTASKISISREAGAQQLAGVANLYVSIQPNQSIPANTTLYVTARYRDKIPVVPGQKYRFGGWYNTQSQGALPAGLSIAFWFFLRVTYSDSTFDDFGTSINNNRATNTYAELATTMTVPTPVGKFVSSMQFYSIAEVINATGAAVSTPNFLMCDTRIDNVYLVKQSSMDDEVFDGPTYGRPLITRLSAGKPLIDFSETIHIAKHLGNMPDDSGSSRYCVLAIDGSRRGIIDLSQGHLNKNLDNVSDTSSRYAAIEARAEANRVGSGNLVYNGGFDTGDSRNWRNADKEHNTGLNDPDAIVLDTAGLESGYVARYAGNSLQVLTSRLIPVNPNKRYYIELRLKGSNTAATFYAGFACFDANKSAIPLSPPGASFSYYLAAAANLPSTYQVYSAVTTPGENAADGSLGFGVMRAGTKFITPLLLLNFNNTAGALEFVDYFKIVEIDSTVRNHPRVSNLDDAGTLDFAPTHRNKHLGNIPDNSGSSRFAVLAIDGSRRAITDWSQSHLNKNADNFADGSTYGRPLLARLNSGKPLIDFSEAIHIAKHLGNIPDDSGSARFAVLVIDGNRRAITDFSQGHLNKNLDNVADTSGRWASPQAGASGDGFQILSNPDFAGGSLTGYSVYDNGGTGRITLTAETDTAAPNSSGYRMKIAVTAAGGTIVPGSGGFFRSIGVDSGAFQIDKYHRGSTIIWRIRAKIPSGYNIGWASNAIGDSPTQVWITSQAGTGDWYEYVFKLVTGSTGTFSTTGFFYIDNGSNTAAVTWYVAMCSAVCTSLPAGYGISDIDGNRRALIDFAISHYNKHIDNLADGSTYGRPLLARLNSGKPWIDFSEGIHSGKHLGNMPDDGTNRCAWGTSAQKNAAVDSSGNLLLKNLQEGTASTNSPTTTSNVPSTLAEMTKTITTKGNKVLILFSGVFQHTDATQAATFDIYRDGSSLSATSLIDIPVANENFPITIAKLDSPSAASHTYDIRWATTGATLTGRALNRLLQVVELG